MERGYYNVNGEDFYRYLDVNLEIQQPVEFDEDGYAIVSARPIGSGEKLDRYGLSRDGEVIGQEPVHKAKLVEIKNGIAYYYNGSLCSAVPTEHVISLREENIERAQEDFIKDKFRRFDSIGWSDLDKQHLRKYLMHPSTENVVYEVAEKYFGMFPEFRNGDQYFVERAQELNNALQAIKKRGEVDLEAKIQQVESKEKTPGQE